MPRGGVIHDLLVTTGVRVEVLSDVSQVLGPVSVAVGIRVGHSVNLVVTEDVVAVYRYTPLAAEKGHYAREGAIRSVGEPGGGRYVTLVLYAYSFLVHRPVTGVVGDVEVAYGLADLAL